MNFLVRKSSIKDLLVQQDIDQALEKLKSTSMAKEKWASMKKRAMSTIRLAISPEIKYNYKKETDPDKCWKNSKRYMFEV